MELEFLKPDFKASKSTLPKSSKVFLFEAPSSEQLSHRAPASLPLSLTSPQNPRTPEKIEKLLPFVERNLTFKKEIIPMVRKTGENIVTGLKTVSKAADDLDDLKKLHTNAKLYDGQSTHGQTIKGLLTKNYPFFHNTGKEKLSNLHTALIGAHYRKKSKSPRRTLIRSKNSFNDIMTFELPEDREIAEKRQKRLKAIEILSQKDSMSLMFPNSPPFSSIQSPSDRKFPSTAFITHYDTVNRNKSEMETTDYGSRITPNNLVLTRKGSEKLIDPSFEIGNRVLTEAAKTLKRVVSSSPDLQDQIMEIDSRKASMAMIVQEKVRKRLFEELILRKASIPDSKVKVARTYLNELRDKIVPEEKKRVTEEVKLTKDKSGKNITLKEKNFKDATYYQFMSMDKKSKDKVMKKWQQVLPESSQLLKL